jgi:predicted small secreted protein
MRHILLVSFLLLNAALLSGCLPAITTAAGIGGSAAITHTTNGITYRTFTASSSKVRVATLSALNRMQIKVVSEILQEKSNIRLVAAKTNERNIEIQIEPISTNTTRMRVTAKSSAFSYDSATAEEIIQQTKRSLG